LLANSRAMPRLNEVVGRREACTAPVLGATSMSATRHSWWSTCLAVVALGSNLVAWSAHRGAPARPRSSQFAALILAASLLAACAPMAGSISTSPAPDPIGQTPLSPLPNEPFASPIANCPRLVSGLRQLLASDDTETFARARGRSLPNGRVRLHLQIAAPEGDLATRYDLRVGDRLGDRLVVDAPIPSLCALVNDSRVRSHSWYLPPSIA
jgi:hypothetical protein